MRNRSFGPLGQRLFVAFLAVALTSVLVLTGAALVGTSQGLNSAEARQREHQAQVISARITNVSMMASDGSVTVGELTQANAAADAFQVGYSLRLSDGSAYFDYGLRNGMGSGMGWNAMGGPDTTGARWTNVPFILDGTTVGELSVRFATPLESTAQTIAWSWILIAGVMSLLVSLLLAVLVSRRIARPLLRISSVATRFAAGDRTARSDSRDARSRWELGDLARAFDATADAVVRSEDARRRISADVAHELRTPLAALQAGLEELRDGLVPADVERLSALHAQSVRLGRVVGDLAALSAAETASLTLQRAVVDVAKTAAEALRIAEPALDTAGIRSALMSSGAAYVIGDEDRLHQAFGNLLTNVARHCRAGDSLEVRVSTADGRVHIRFADTGPGIPDQELPHVFDRLWRGAGAADVSGSGIGLAVVRELIAAHAGEVTVNANQPGGSVFTISLPLAPGA